MRVVTKKEGLKNGIERCSMEMEGFVRRWVAYEAIDS